MLKAGITAHMVVKNEDQWVWFAIKSVLPYVDSFLITDTGSTDHTIEIIRMVKSPKIKFTQQITRTADDITQVREDQLKATTTDWIWIVDGDEIYPKTTAEEVVKAVKSAKYEGILVRRHDLLGDIYHYQDESVGSYHLFGQTGHLLTRLINKKKINGLHYQGTYPNEGFYDSHGVHTNQRNCQAWYTTATYLYHAMYLRRSSLGSILKSVINRSKYKVETGHKMSDALPKVFFLPRPSVVPDPLVKRSLSYELAAGLITPVKKLKRKMI